MRKIYLTLLSLVLLTTVDVSAQDKKPLSPQETVKGVVDGSNVEIVYCRPSARGRKMLGGVEPYGKVWRTGANAATTISFDKDVTVEGKALPAGKYALFTIPNENEWVIIFNKKYDTWGAYDYEKNKGEDALQVTVKAGKAKAFVETFTMGIEKNQVNLQWENTAVSFQVRGK
jgi:hypothetical protein